MNSVLRTYEVPFRVTSSYGYKVFKKVGKSYKPAVKKNRRFYANKWYHDSSKGDIGGAINVLTGVSKLYPKGFHILKHKDDAENLVDYDEVVMKVKYDNVVAYGEDGGDCIIARSLMIIE